MNNLIEDLLRIFSGKQFNTEMRQDKNGAGNVQGSCQSLFWQNSLSRCILCMILNQVQTVVWAETCTFANLLPISHFCAAIAQSPLKPFNVKHNSEFSMKCNLALFSSWNLARIPSWSKSSSRVSGGLDKLWRNCPAVFYFSNRQRQRNQHKWAKIWLFVHH